MSRCPRRKRNQSSSAAALAAQPATGGSKVAGRMSPTGRWSGEGSGRRHDPDTEDRGLVSAHREFGLGIMSRCSAAVAASCGVLVSRLGMRTVSWRGDACQHQLLTRSCSRLTAHTSDDRSSQDRCGQRDAHRHHRNLQEVERAPGERGELGQDKQHVGRRAGNGNRPGAEERGRERQLAQGEQEEAGHRRTQQVAGAFVGVVDQRAPTFPSVLEANQVNVANDTLPIANRMPPPVVRRAPRRAAKRPRPRTR